MVDETLILAYNMNYRILLDNEENMINIRHNANTKKIALTAMFTALIIVGAFIKIPIPGIPFTMQFLFINFAMLMMGPLWSGAAILIYIIMGLIGLPVFTAGGGFTYVLYPTFGYLIGFFVGCLVTGSLLQRMKLKRRNFLIMSVINMLIVYVFGMIYFYFIQTLYMGVTVSAKTVLISCFLLFLPGDTLWCIFSSVIAFRLRRFRVAKSKVNTVNEPPECNGELGK